MVPETETLLGLIEHVEQHGSFTISKAWAANLRAEYEVLEEIRHRVADGWRARNDSAYEPPWWVDCDGNDQDMSGEVAAVLWPETDA